VVRVTTTFHVNDTFNDGQSRLSALLAAQSGEPEGYVPQHDKAHVHWPTVGFRNGYPVCYLMGQRCGSGA
jgi:hypothetical protein